MPKDSDKLVDSLAQKLVALDTVPEQSELRDSTPSPSGRYHRVHEGYGFRPPSGISTPLMITQPTNQTLVPDVHGLGWPGQFNLP